MKDAALNTLQQQTLEFSGPTILRGFYLTAGTIIELKESAQSWSSAVPVSFTFVSSEELTLSLPSKPSGTVVDVRLTTSNRQVIKQSAFTYP